MSEKLAFEPLFNGWLINYLRGGSERWPGDAQSSQRQHSNQSVGCCYRDRSPIPPFSLSLFVQPLFVTRVNSPHGPYRRDFTLSCADLQPTSNSSSSLGAAELLDLIPPQPPTTSGISQQLLTQVFSYFCRIYSIPEKFGRIII